jgi:transposase
VDASVNTKTDKLGRRTGPRRKYPLADKLRILHETRQPGASVSDVARAHGVNANVVFAWRRLAKRGLLRAPAPESVQLLPVKVESPTVLPGKKTASVPATPDGEHASIEVEFPGGVRVRVHGTVDTATLKHVFEALPRR